MGVYHQIGSKSANLIRDQRLSRYRGAILSPVDYSEAATRKEIVEPHQLPHAFECILDPQLYFPKAARGQLPSWEYYPQDVDTADLGSRAWWNQRVLAISKVSRRLSVAAVCSPAVIPRSYSASYYSLMIDVAEELHAELSPNGIEVLPSIIVHLRDLASQSNVLEIASILTRASGKRAYVVFVAEVEPRRELVQSEDLAGAMRLIKHIENAGLKTLVGYTSSDVVLWKTARASDCATGKFFNLRRFTPSRWDPPSQGGGQLPYWFEESILAFVREADILRLRDCEKISVASQNNPYFTSILEHITASPRKAWLGLSWTQYMYWYQEVEYRLQHGTSAIDEMLRVASKNWAELQGANVFLEEPQNDGRWIPRWSRTVEEFMGSEL